MCEYCEKRKTILCYCYLDETNSSVFNPLNQVIVPEDVWLHDIGLWKICETEILAPPKELPLLGRLWRFFHKKCPICGRKLNEEELNEV